MEASATTTRKGRNGMPGVCMDYESIARGINAEVSANQKQHLPRAMKTKAREDIEQGGDGDQ